MGIIAPPLPTPFIFGDYPDGSSSAATFVANTVTLYSWVLNSTVTVTNMRCGFSVFGNGHYDLGIYDATGTNTQPGTLLAHCASTNTSLATASGLQSPALLATTTFQPGKYWIAIWIDNNTDTFYKMSITITGQSVCMQGTNAGPLPSSAGSISGLANFARKVGVFGLIQGGWS